MDERREELTKLRTYIEGIDNELTMILETLQWDKKKLLQSPALVTCRHDSNHKVPPDKIEEHEKACFLIQNGYSKDDQLLPDPLDLESNTLVKLGKEDIQQIIANAARSDETFKKGVGCHDAEPLCLERLQSSYSTDERRAIHDAVVAAVPSCHDLTDLALLSGGDDKSSKVILSRQEILLELRNMRRRRTKYRVAAKSRNYSDVLRDVIRTQMEHYSDAKTETDPKEIVDREHNLKDKHNEDRRHSRAESKDDRCRYDGKAVPWPIKIKMEREDSTERNYRDNNQRDYSRARSDRIHRNETGSRDGRDRDYRRRDRDDRSRDRRNYHGLERTQKYEEHSRNRNHDDKSSERRSHYEESADRRKVNDPNKEERTQHYGEHSRKRSHEDESRERRSYYEEPEEKIKVNELDKEKRPRNSHRHKDYNDEYEKINYDKNNHRRETSRERRYDEKRDKAHSHNDKNDRRRYRGSSREKRDKRYEERPSETIRIKQEREDSVSRDETYENTKAKDSSGKSKSRRHDRSHREDRNYAGHNVEIKQEKYARYYDVPSEESYDPNKIIKEEQ